MTQFDPPRPPDSVGPVDYGAVPARASGMAVASMILGIISIPLTCALIGVPLAIVGIVLGIVAIGKINREPQVFSGKGFAIAGIVTSAVAFLGVGPLLIAILLPSLGKARELANRSTCAANCRGIMQSLIVYSNDNADAYPTVLRGARPLPGAWPSPVPYTLASDNFGSFPTSDSATESWYKGGPYNNVPANMWLLVLRGQVAPKQFLCKSDPANGTPALVTNAAGNFYNNFNNGSGPNDLAYSYSFAFPLTPKGEVGGWWKNTNDAAQPVMADMAPKPSATVTPAASGKSANSFNHQRDGQNVGYGDGHAEFVRVPQAGQDNDNIWTSGRGTPSATGTPWTSPTIEVGGSPGSWDIMMVPVADEATHVRH